MGILLGLLLASGQCDMDLSGCAFAGELSLDGRLRPVRGALSMVLAARQAGIQRVFLPMENGGEGAAIPGITVHPVATGGVGGALLNAALVLLLSMGLLR